MTRRAARGTPARSAASESRSHYDTPDAWAGGPGPYYERLGAWLIGLAPVRLAGRRLLDLGAGTGAVSMACLAAGAVPVAADLSVPMLRHRRDERPPAVCCDASALPFTAGAFDAVTAGFSFSHVPDVDRAAAECARVLAPGGVLLASAFTCRHPHPAQAAIEAALAAAGWVPPPWYRALKSGGEALLADPLRLLDVATGAGFGGARVVVERVDTGIHTAEALAAWRLGMPQCAGFLAGLPAGERQRVRAGAIAAAEPHAGPLRPEVAALIAVR